MSAVLLFLRSDSPEKLKFSNGTSPLPQKLLAILAVALTLRLLTHIERIGPRISLIQSASREPTNIEIRMPELFL